MVSHLVCRRSFTPYGVILYHPCGAHSQASHDDADEPVFGDGPLCEACEEPAESGAVIVAGAATVQMQRPVRTKTRD